MSGPKFKLGDAVRYQGMLAEVKGRTFQAEPVYDLDVCGEVHNRVPEDRLEALSEGEAA